MSFTTLTGFAAGLLQFIVAAYALRLNRLFGTIRVGWSLFCAFTLLALLHLAQILKPINGAISYETEVEITYALVSLLLLTGMIHLESLLKERKKLDQREQQLRGELEQEIKKKTAYLTRAIEELQSEIDERKRMETVVENNDFELRAASRQIEMAGLANRVLHMTGSSLTDIKTVADRIGHRLQESPKPLVEHVEMLIQEPLANLDQVAPSRSKIEERSQLIRQLAEELHTKELHILNDLEELKSHLGKVVWMRQNYIQLADTLNQTTDATAQTKSTPKNEAAASPSQKPIPSATMAFHLAALKA